MASPQLQQTRRRLRPVLFSVILLALASVGAWWFVRSRSLYAQLAAIAPERPIAPLTSLDVRYGECVVTQTDSLVPQATCAQHSGLSSSGAAEILKKVNRRIDAGRDPEALRIKGLIELYGSEHRAPRPQEAIFYFDSALQLTRDSADVMADLSAAYLLLAEASQSVGDLVQALEWSKWALELQPRLARAWFNRALALEALMADLSARRAWRDYLAVTEPTGFTAYLRRRSGQEWRREAEQRLRALEAMAPPSPPASDAGERAWTTFALNYPQPARQQAWERMLGEWAAAVEANDSALAATWLRRAEVVGQELVSRPDGDAMVADYVGEIRSRMAHGADLHGHARAQLIEQQATQAVRDLDYARADSLLRALRPDSLTPPGRIWTLLQRAGSLIEQAKWEEAGEALNAARARTDTLRYPVAAGYALWLRGTIQARQGGFAEAVSTWKSALAVYDRVREPASRARIQGFIAEALTEAGNADAASEWYQRAVRTSRYMGPTVTRHNVLRAAAMSAELMGKHRAMRDLADEDVAVADSVGDPAFIAEARLNRAALLAVSGQSELAVRDLSGIARPDSSASASVREFVTMASAYVRAVAQLESTPQSVAATVAPLIGYRGSEFWHVRGLALRAHAAAKLGQAEGARGDLETMIEALTTIRTNSAGAARKAPADVNDAAARVVRLMVDRGDAIGSLQLLERVAAATSPIDVGEAALPREIPRGRVVIRPMLVDSTLVVWTMAGRIVQMTRTPVNPDSVRAAISLVASSLPLDWEVDGERAYLYGLLVRPAEWRLGAVGDQVVFVDDPALGSIPYAALLNGAGEPLVRDHPVWTAVSIAAAATPADASPPATVAVFAPDFDPAPNPGLDSLPSAKPERQAVVTLYGRRVLSVTETPEGFQDALARAEVVHFAGHAVTDPIRPERSYLVLEPGAQSSAGHLAARELGLQNDSAVRARGTSPRLRLVVLSACSTLGDASATPGLTGLSGALLDRGARGVIGSLWKVDDGPTRTLMVRFHSHYAGSGDPHRALWEAQGAAIDDDQPPRVWAAFRYVGR